jgi:hypothetical protein
MELTRIAVLLAALGWAQTPAPASSVIVTGCLQREPRGVGGVKSPSGYVLTNASTSAYGGSAESTPGTGAPAGAAAGSPRQQSTPAPATESRPQGGAPEHTGSGAATSTRTGTHGSGLSPGLTFLLEGSNLKAHAGERVEARGTLRAANTLRVAALRTIAKSCS